jgi:hypothetical protein
MTEHQVDEEDPEDKKALSLLQEIQSLIGTVAMAWSNLDSDLIHILPKTS